MTSYRGRWLVMSGLVLWALCVLYVIACLTSPIFADCELSPGSSFYGEPSRSWLPPGTTCTYDLRGTGIPAEESLVIGPSTVRLLVVGAGVVGLPVILYLRRLLIGAATAMHREHRSAHTSG